ncbi:MAG: ATP-binding cassette domain-containing protein [Acidimicrobiaceae bacterium]|nr:ATP-binding cassette domain-containing protein [Acidimicrobiaceae bacterium]
MTGDAPLLKTDAVSVRFGGVRAVDSVSLEFHRGVVTGIIGPNGAGKSSFIDAVSGRILPTSGRVWFEGTDVTRWPLYRRARAGLVRTFQTTSEFSGLTVFENLIAAAVGPDGAGFARSLRGGRVVEQANHLAWDRSWEVLERFEMAHTANLLGAELSGGQRRLLEIMRCLVRRPKLVLLDEPMVGIAQHLVAKLVEELRRVAAEGVGIVVIEHALEVIGALTDRVVVMAAGGVLADDRYENVVEDRRVQLAYLA